MNNQHVVYVFNAKCTSVRGVPVKSIIDLDVNRCK